jgi:hypothetical protein
VQADILQKVRIEMLSNQVLLYLILPGIKLWLEKWIIEGPFDHVPAADSFLCFSASPGRVVFVRIQDIKHISIDFEPVSKKSFCYYNNFDSTLSSSSAKGDPTTGGDQGLPSAFVRLRNNDETLVFRKLNHDAGAIQINEVNLWQPFFFESGFIPFLQDDGKKKYIPVTNISCMETDRLMVSPQDPWDGIQEDDI